jgi:hypothetical protein
MGADQLDIGVKIQEGEKRPFGKKARQVVTMTHFTQNSPITKKIQAALVLAIDLNKYRWLLESRGY